MTTTFMPSTMTITVSHAFNGLPLDDGEYRLNNLEKSFSILRSAIDANLTAYQVESTSEPDTTLSVKLKKLDHDLKYLMLQTLNTTTKLVIFTNASEAELNALLTECFTDYKINSLGAAATNTLPVARVLTHLSKHQTVGKAARKAKEFSGSSLTNEQKTKTVYFKLTPLFN